MTWALVLQIFTAIGGLAGFSAVVNLLVSRKKIAAESDDIIQSTTDKVIKNLTTDNDTLRGDTKAARLEVVELRKQNAQLYDIIEQMETGEMETRRSLIRYINYSRQAYDKLNESGINFEPPPGVEIIKRVVHKDNQL